MTIHRYDVLASTNDEARRLALAGAPHGDAVVAARQTGGRGRLGRSWISPPGNLYVSVILRSPGSAGSHPQVAFVAGLAVVDAVRPLPASLKWPNDVLLAGAKVAGVLVESDGGALVCGIGVNVAQAPAGLPYPATALAAHGPTNLEAVLAAVLAGLDHWWQVWLANGFAAIRTAWLQRGPAPGDPLIVTQGPRRTAGRFAGMDMDGALLLQTAAGVQRILAGDVSGA